MELIIKTIDNQRNSARMYLAIFVISCVLGIAFWHNSNEVLAEGAWVLIVSALIALLALGVNSLAGEPLAAFIAAGGACLCLFVVGMLMILGYSGIIAAIGILLLISGMCTIAITPPNKRHWILAGVIVSVLSILLIFNVKPF